MMYWWATGIGQSFLQEKGNWISGGEEVWKSMCCSLIFSNITSCHPILTTRRGCRDIKYPIAPGSLVIPDGLKIYARVYQDYRGSIHRNEKYLLWPSCSWVWFLCIHLPLFGQISKASIFVLFWKLYFDCNYLIFLKKTIQKAFYCNR